MAVIGKIRQKSGLVIAIVGIALAAFVLGDLFKSSNTRGTLLIGEVNGAKIVGADFNKDVEQNINFQKSNYQRALTPQETFNVKQQTWNKMVQDILTESEYEALGLAVSSEELVEQLSGPNPHDWAKRNFVNQQGVYDPIIARTEIGKFTDKNAEQQNQWIEIEKYITGDRLRNKYNNLIGKSYYVPTAIAKNDYEAKGAKATVEYIGIKYNTISDSAITLTDADYKEYYNKHKEDYKLEEELRAIDYVVFEIRPSVEDLQSAKVTIDNVFEALKTEEDIPSFVNLESDRRYDSTWIVKGQLPARIEETMFNSEVGTTVGPYQENEAFHIAKLMEVANRPDSMKASHILVPYLGAANADPSITRTKAEAKLRADSILDVVNGRRIDFAEKAKELSEGPSAPRGGDLGWFADGGMVHNFNQAVIDGKKGDLIIAETQFGYHIIKIEDKKEDLKKIRVALIDREISSGNKTNNDIYAKASAFAGQNRDLASFEAAAKENGYNVKSHETFNKMTISIPGIDNARNIAQWTFKEDTELGTVSDVMEIDNSYLVAVVKNIKKEGYQPLEDVKDEMEVLVKRDKKAEIAIQRIESALKSSKDLNTIASELGVTVESTENLTFKSYNLPKFGREVKVIGSVFKLAEGSTSNIIEGNTAAFVIKLNKIIPAAAISDYTTNQKTMATAFERKASREVITALENKADIQDNRNIFY